MQVVVNQGHMGQPYYGHQQQPMHPHHMGQVHPHYSGNSQVAAENGPSSPNAKVRRSGMPLNSDCHLMNTNETLLVSVMFSL